MGIFLPWGELQDNRFSSLRTEGFSRSAVICKSIMDSIFIRATSGTDSVPSCSNDKDNMNGERKAKHYGQYFMNLSNLVRSLFLSNDCDEEHMDDNNEDFHLEE